jgi:Xaa-Pro aminopeptidase
LLHGFDDFVGLGDNERQIGRKFAADLLLRGADKIPSTSVSAGPGGCTSIIMGPTDRHVAQGDVMFIDAVASYGGYFCDFGRNVCFPPPSDEIVRIRDTLGRVAGAEIAASRTGITRVDVFLPRRVC